MITKTPPTKLSSPLAGQVGLLLAIMLSGMALLQLTSFEAFTRIITQYELGGSTLSIVLAIKLIALEIIAIPFLARLWLSPLARVCSALATVLAPVAWLVVVLSGLIGNREIPNAGILGGFIGVPLGLALLSTVTLGGALWWSFRHLGGMQALRGLNGKHTATPTR